MTQTISFALTFTVEVDDELAVREAAFHMTNQAWGTHEQRGEIAERISSQAGLEQALISLLTFGEAGQRLQEIVAGVAPGLRATGLSG